MITSSKLPKVYTSKEAAEILRIDIQTLYKYARENAIESIQINRKTRLFTEEYIMRFLEKNSCTKFN